MGLTDEGATFIAGALVGSEATLYDNSNAQIAVGNGSSAFSAAQTGLQGSSKQFHAMDSGYPSRSSNTVLFQAVYPTSEANFAWKEWGIFNGGNSSADMLCRVAESLGTKTSKAQWTFQVQISISAA